MEQGVLLLIYYLTAASSIIVAEDEDGKNSGCCGTRNIALGYRIDRHRTATDESCDNEGASGDENNNLANKTSASSSSDDPQSVSSSSSGTMTTVMQCLGTCPGQGTECLPTLTRLKSVRLLDGVVGGGGVIDSNLKKPRRKRRGEKRRWPSVSISVVEHLRCQCLPVSAPSTDMAEAAAGRARNPRFASGPPDHAGPVPPAFSGPSLSSSSSSSSSRAASNTKQTPAPADVVFANDSREERTRMYYETCQACKKQWDYCEDSGQIFDHDVCHCVYPATKTFLNSFYTLGVVMLTVMVCCFLVFGVQKGDENVLNSSRRRNRGSSDSGSDAAPAPADAADPATVERQTCSYRRGDGSVDAEAVPGETDVAEVTAAAGNGTAATEPLLAPSAKGAPPSAVHPSDNIRPFTMAALNSVTISSGKGNKRGGKFPPDNHRGKSRKNGRCGIRNGVSGQDGELGAAPNDGGAVSTDDNKSGELSSDAKLPKGTTDIFADTER